MTISEVTELLGWASIINISYLLLATLMIVLMKDTVISIHRKMFGVDAHELSDKYFNFLSHYKIMTLVFIVAPYIALKIMGE